VASSITIGLNAVILAVTNEVPRILTVSRPDGHGGQIAALPFGPLDPEADRTLELGLRRWVLEQTGLSLGYVEQLYTFADRDREPRTRRRKSYAMSIAYLALAREGNLAPGLEANWLDVYSLLPWEDRREGTPAEVERDVAPALARWAEASLRQRASRRERADLAFGLGGAAHDADSVLERYELLYEASLVHEAVRDANARRQRKPPKRRRAGLGVPMAFDHRRMVATALGRVRGKIQYRPVVFELLPETFTLLRLQRVVEALAGLRLHKQNFRRLVDRAGLVEGTGEFDDHTGGRPAELFRFRRKVLRERQAPGVGLPQVKL
jgi:hypothetical protein